MKTWILTVLATLGTSTSWADGFICTTLASDLKVAVYNKILPVDGVRNPAAMIVSDPTVTYGLKTITTFLGDTGTLSTGKTGSSQKDSDQLTYTGYVDLRFTESGDAGEYILGTRLGEVENIVLKIEFSYGDDLAHGEQTAGLVLVQKRDGEVLERLASCTRYLKTQTAGLELND